MGIGYAYEVFEDFNGQIHLAILDLRLNCVCYQNDYAKRKKDLVNDLNRLYFTNDFTHVESIDNPGDRYKRIIDKKHTRAWVIATNKEIFWEAMNRSGKNIIEKYKSDIAWEYDDGI
jgi:hypothetical protein